MQRLRGEDKPFQITLIPVVQEWAYDFIPFNVQFIIKIRTILSDCPAKKKQPQWQAQWMVEGKN